ncbi:bifunctional 5,10-methylenetetrahydrofolate dehydrogenase/5,10-methenyltetrahydrofolate cyclohydrolase [Dehalococcoides mccartyi]|jgi:methylenetetrahydrofolate dehydrogenase (NADP+)/methenyltetrahydrofolate cyclohydrolase|uniref:Bifunctional protein FolD n=2 Tax=Dehalococcoides mccartyi TaxID=61435 RepID=FOLD_DEHMC|nr:bifunctional methylenetetrahydrofolate dehydrogenase/methenyltetrahydrofolate cyclohydrolase [Dehalococcoides mccartyi]Q3ZX43.1 RecName: Full=Bifunctional protein FolD; Includes: RecName: Full=Methylenetetrahydrofolate dehydrogenase; Includes: RecName: Full=Methenyltetrahydrofolate cyclohydrolase [Dehalococcoides mccartyi CBDB1]AII60761.1 bifunctional 5,10-methylene-tetrahydrofolate dehydrogenase/ 5,10-methylene-tetrahydrofolate cyclohydrolase [Dehalococcoides mccartyi CG5]AMU86431.1 methylen
MSAHIINGTEIAAAIREEIRSEVTALKTKAGIVPGLATVLVGDDPASHSYVDSKIKMCQNLGIYSEHHPLPQNATNEDLLTLIAKLNADPKISGILVQVPLPAQISESLVLNAINPDKDVDGFHPVNVGRMCLGEPCFLPCTPHGVQELLIRSGIKIEGTHVVIVGRSNLVGKPLANILLQKAPGANATVTICHSGTKNLPEITRQADILVAAMGKPKFITADMVREGAVVIDVGTTCIGYTPEGKRILSGDVDFEEVKEKAFAITPVPKGVGPMTIIMLMLNTLTAAKRAVGLIK